MKLLRGRGFAIVLLVAVVGCSQGIDDSGGPAPGPDASSGAIPGQGPIDAAPQPDPVDGAPVVPDGGLGLGDCDPPCGDGECCTPLGSWEAEDNILCELGGGFP